MASGWCLATACQPQLQHRPLISQSRCQCQRRRDLETCVLPEGNCLADLSCLVSGSCRVGRRASRHRDASVPFGSLFPQTLCPESCLGAQGAPVPDQVRRLRTTKIRQTLAIAQLDWSNAVPGTCAISVGSSGVGSQVSRKWFHSLRMAMARRNRFRVRVPQGLKEALHGTAIVEPGGAIEPTLRAFISGDLRRPRGLLGSTDVTSWHSTAGLHR